MREWNTCESEKGKNVRIKEQKCSRNNARKLRVNVFGKIRVKVLIYNRLLSGTQGNAVRAPKCKGQGAGGQDVRQEGSKARIKAMIE